MRKILRKDTLWCVLEIVRIHRRGVGGISEIFRIKGTSWNFSLLAFSKDLNNAKGGHGVWASVSAVFLLVLTEVFSYVLNVFGTFY